MNTYKKTGTSALLLTAALTLGAASAFGGGGPLVIIDTVTVGNIGNAADGTGYGAVSYEYQIGKYEVTNAQYAAFLNAVVGTGADTYSLYNGSMSITRNGSNVFVVNSGYDYKPVTYVSFYDAARFVNWLTAGNTEEGLYTFSGVTTLVSTPDHAAVAAGSGGWVIASENEWYKAAYYNPTLNGGAGGYTNYPWEGGRWPSHDRYAVNGANFGANPFPPPYPPEEGPYPPNEGAPGTVTDVGYYMNAKSYYGTFDQAGNVAEVVDTIYEGGDGRAMRGGAFEGRDEFGRDLSAWDGRAAAGSPNYDGSIIGFRVVNLTTTAVPEPRVVAGAIGLAALIIGFWLRRSRRTL